MDIATDIRYLNNSHLIFGNTVIGPIPSTTSINYTRQKTPCSLFTLSLHGEKNYNRSNCPNNHFRSNKTSSASIRAFNLLLAAALKGLTFINFWV